MSEQIWETFDALYKTCHRQGRQIDELEQRIKALELRLSQIPVPPPQIRIAETNHKGIYD